MSSTANRKARRLQQHLVSPTDAYTEGEGALHNKERRQMNLQSFLRANCFGAISRNTWLFVAEKFGKFLSWNEMACNNKGIFFPVVSNLRNRADDTNNPRGKVTKEYWFFEICAGAPNICQVQVYDATGQKKVNGKMKVFSDACGNVTNENMDLFMSWQNFIHMPPLPLISTTSP